MKNLHNQCKKQKNAQVYFYDIAKIEMFIL